MIDCVNMHIKGYLQKYFLNYLIGENTIVGSHSYRRRKLEIMQELNFLEDQMRIYPHARKEVQGNIKVLLDMLGDLEYQYQQLTNNRS